MNASELIWQIFAIFAVAAGLIAWVLRLRLPDIQTESAGVPVGLPPNPAPWHQVLWKAALWALGSRLVLVAFGAVLALCSGRDMSFHELWNRWDAPHYLDIVNHGYSSDQSLGDLWLFIVFYPLYPAVTALLKPLFGGAFAAGLAVSWISLIGACYGLYRLGEQDGGPEQGWRAVQFLILMPAAVFLGAPYTESLFLALSILCLWSLRRGRWWLAGVAGFLSALTRNLGVLLLVPFAVEFLQRQGVLREPKRFLTRDFWRAARPPILWALLIPLGLVVYLFLNWKVYGDAFMFLKVQDEHWSQHMQAFWRSVGSNWWSVLADRSIQNRAFFWIPQFVGMVAMLTALPVLVRRLRPSDGAYLIVYLIVALSPSWLLSFNRYMMGAAPLMLALAAFGRKPWLDVLLSCVLGALMLFLAFGYLMGFFVV